MLRRVQIQGFKSLDELDIELGRFNVFVGTNGSGKTNVLEAIGLAGCAASGKVDDNAFHDRGLRPGLPVLYKTALTKAERIPRLIRLRIQSADGAEYRVALDNPIDKPQAAWRIANEAVVEPDGAVIASRGPGGARLALESGATRDAVELDPTSTIAQLAQVTLPSAKSSALLKALGKFAIYTPFTPMLRGTTPDPSQRPPVGLSGGRLPEAVTQVLFSPGGKQRIREFLRLIDWAKGVRVGTPDEAKLSPAVSTTKWVLSFQDRHMVDRRSWLSAFDASEGALYVLFLMILAVHPQSPPILAVDNVDQALNPALARALIEHIQGIVLAEPERPQLLLTAHSPLVLDALDLKHDEVRLFIVDRKRSGATAVRRLQHSEALEKAHEQGMTLSRMWLSGLLGGMPDL